MLLSYAERPARVALRFYLFLRGEMQNITENKTIFIRINLGLSEATVRCLAKGARRAIEMARPKPASDKATTV